MFKYYKTQHVGAFWLVFLEDLFPQKARESEKAIHYFVQCQMLKNGPVRFDK